MEEPLCNTPPLTLEGEENLDPLVAEAVGGVSALVSSTHNPELHELSPPEDEGRKVHGELLAAARMQFSEEEIQEPKATGDNDDEKTPDYFSTNSDDIFD